MDGSILTTLAMAEDFADGTVAAQRGGAVFHIGDISYAMGYGQESIRHSRNAPRTSWTLRALPLTHSWPCCACTVVVFILCC